MLEKNSCATCLAAIPLLALCPSVQAAESNDPGTQTPALTALSIESLMEIEITTASKHPESLKKTAAAVSVMTNEDLRRSGARTLAEALRYVPGLNVARVDASGHAISARGFNDTFANKLLVMIDGRTVYTPLFSGVFWSDQDALIEDVERVEVIRGPGASLWGANAVNGVVNIITKRAEDTVGGYLEGGGGYAEPGFGAGRYGAKLGEATWARVYFKYDNHAHQKLPDGSDAFDAWDKYQGGFRLDWRISDRSDLTFQGDALYSEVEQVFTETSAFPPFATPLDDHLQTHLANLLARFTCELANESTLTIQTYVDASIRDSLFLREERTNFDIDAQHKFNWGERQSIVWGLGYRVSDDSIRGNPSLSFDPPDRTTDLAAAFFHDEISIVEEKLRLTIGARFEHNDFTGFEVQPNARLLWSIHSDHNLWASVSRAVRTPSRAEDGIDLRQPTGIPGVLTALSGNPNFFSEDLIAYEAGYNARLHDRVSLNLSLFYNDYNDIRSVEPGPTRLGLPIVMPLVISNLSVAETYGFEIAPSFQITDWWRLQPAYSFLKMQFHLKPGSADPTGDVEEGQSPEHQVSVWSRMNLPHNIDFDAGLRFVDGLPSLGVPHYTEVDIRIAWRPKPQWEISLVAQNILDVQHPEFGTTYLVTEVSEVRRSVYGKVSWRF